MCRSRRHVQRLTAALAAALTVLCVALDAGAHGAFPKVLQAVADPSDPNRIWARATHGMLRSSDAGKSWYWLCTQAAGYAQTDEPLMGVTASGALLMGTFGGLLVSADQGCGWANPSVSLATSVTGLAVDEGNPSRVVVLLSTGASGGKFQSELWQSLDAGVTFQKVSSLDPNTLYLSVGIASSDPARLYLTGLPGAGGGKCVAFRSGDSGQTWASAELPAAPGSGGEIVGVHPSNPDVVFVRTKLTTSDATEGALLASSDGAESFAVVLKKAAPLMGFTLSPDGSSAFAAYGNPRGGVVVSEPDLGLYVAATSNNSFARVQAGPVACASFIAGELWACTSQFDHGFELGRSSDGGKSFTKVMELAGITGPVECPATSTVGTVCPTVERSWDDVCRDIGKCEVHPGGGGNSSSSSTDDGSCGCRAGSGRGVAPPGVLALLAILALGFRPRRRVNVS